MVCFRPDLSKNVLPLPVVVLFFQSVVRCPQKTIGARILLYGSVFLIRFLQSILLEPCHCVQGASPRYVFVPMNLPSTCLKGTTEEKFLLVPIGQCLLHVP